MKAFLLSKSAATSAASRHEPAGADQVLAKPTDDFRVPDFFEVVLVEVADGEVVATAMRRNDIPIGFDHDIGKNIVAALAENDIGMMIKYFKLRQSLQLR